MIKLINQFINLIPFPIWISENKKIININICFSSMLNINLSNIDFIDEYIILKSEDLELFIQKKNNYSFMYDGKTYTHKIIKETINNKEIELGILLNEASLNNLELNKTISILQTIIDNVPEIIFYKDKNCRYMGANKHCIEFYKALGVTEFIGKKDIDLNLNKDFIETCSKHDTIVLNTKKQLFIEEKLKSSDNKEYIFETIKTPIINHDDVLGIVGVARNITTRKEEEEKLRYLSYTDILTGLYNRTFFDEKVDCLIRNKRFPIGIIMGDINGLKIVNDTFGHILGDKLIKKISQIIKTSCNNNELIFRWGGDEFIILIPNVYDRNCEKLIEDINLGLNNNSSEKIPLSMAMGYSLINDEKSVDKALMEAEEKLYRQKILNGKSMRSSILSTLQESLNFKNVETAKHTERLVNYCVKMAKVLNLKHDTVNELILLAKLHDIGKIAIPEKILLKDSSLTQDEYEIMKTHAEKGYRLAMTLPEISHVARGILTHHERWDGKGYPLGLKGEEIPFIARIVSVADSYDEMTSNRIYNKIKTKEEAIDELKRCAGHQFDPKIVEIFCSII